MRRSAWERALALASNRSCSRSSFAWWKTPQKPHRAPFWKTWTVTCPSFVPFTHSEGGQLLFINLDDVGHAGILHVFLQLPTKHPTFTCSLISGLSCRWQNCHFTSKPFCSFSTRHWTSLLESLEESSVVEAGTSGPATRFVDSSASLCPYALLAAMLSPKLETEVHKKASDTKKKSPSNMGLTAVMGSLGGAWLQATRTAPCGHAPCGGRSGPVRAESQSSGPEPVRQKEERRGLSASLRVCTWVCSHTCSSL